MCAFGINHQSEVKAQMENIYMLCHSRKDLVGVCEGLAMAGSWDLSKITNEVLDSIYSICRHYMKLFWLTRDKISGPGRRGILMGLNLIAFPYLSNYFSLLSLKLDKIMSRWVENRSLHCVWPFHFSLPKNFRKGCNYAHPTKLCYFFKLLVTTRKSFDCQRFFGTKG